MQGHNEHGRRWSVGAKIELTVVEMFIAAGVVVEAEQNGADIVLGTRRGVGRVPLDVLRDADLPLCSLSGLKDVGRVDDIHVSSDGGGGGGDGRCGRRRSEGAEGGEKSGEELHRGSSRRKEERKRNRNNPSTVRLDGRGNGNEEERGERMDGWMG